MEECTWSPQDFSMQFMFPQNTLKGMQCCCKLKHNNIDVVSLLRNAYFSQEESTYSSVRNKTTQSYLEHQIFRDNRGLVCFSVSFSGELGKSFTLRWGVAMITIGFL